MLAIRKLDKQVFGTSKIVIPICLYICKKKISTATHTPNCVVFFCDGNVGGHSIKRQNNVKLFVKEIKIIMVVISKEEIRKMTEHT